MRGVVERLILGALAGAVPSVAAEPPEQETLIITGDARRLATFQVCSGDAERALARQDLAQLVGVWQSCLEHARQLSDTELIAAVEPQLLAARVREKLGSLRSTDPMSYARKILSYEARSPNKLPTDFIQEAWLMMVADPELRQSMDVRQVSLRIQPSSSVDEATQEASSAVFRRHLIDHGFKAPEPYSASDSSSDLVLSITLSAREEQVAQSGGVILHGVTFTLERTSFNYRSLGQRSSAGAVQAKGTGLTKEEATEQALQNTGEVLAAIVLRDVIRLLY